MVTVGDEGMRSNGSTAEPHSWLNNGSEGVDFECNLSAPNIDVRYFLIFSLALSLLMDSSVNI